MASRVIICAGTMMLAASPTFFSCLAFFKDVHIYVLKNGLRACTVEPDDEVTRLSTMDLSVKIERGGKK
jgi:hypothetical protein